MAHSADTDDRILEKITFVREAVQLLERKRVLDQSVYLEGVEALPIVERKFQTAIEACIDIAELLIVESGESTPFTNAEKVLRLGDQRIVSRKRPNKWPRLQEFETSSRTKTVLISTTNRSIDTSRQISNGSRRSVEQSTRSETASCHTALGPASS